MNADKVWRLRGVLILLFAFLCLYPRKEINASVSVSAYEELRQVLGRTGSETVELQKDLYMEGPVVIRGNKVIHGQGHCLERSRKKDKVYGGSLFLMQGESCVLRNVTISGAGKSKQVAGKVFGRLLEVRQGTVLLEDRCILRDNINDRLAVDGGGALLIGKGGNCIIKEAVIQGNQNVSRGAGICVEAGGCLTVKGGVIRDNSTVGAGAIEGFDGRGGAIYSEGKVILQDALIRDNQAVPYRENAVAYGGVGAAIFSGTKASLCIRGGTFSGNSDGRNCPIWTEGCLALGGTVTLERIYLGKAAVVQAENTLESKKDIELHPAVYRKGVCVARGKRVPLALSPENGYELMRRKKGYYLGPKTKKKEKPEGAGRKPQKEMKPVKNVPVICCKKTELVFYVGERVDREVLLYGVTAKDSREGDITEKIRLRGLQGDMLDTGRVKSGELVYEVENGQGVKAKKKTVYRIKQNHAPKFRTAPRYLFTWEVEGYTDRQWKQLLLQECLLTDDCETQQDLENDTIVELGEIKEFTKGCREMILKVRDQSGHRYYMKPGERRRYGKGRITTVKISVTLVDGSVLDTGEALGRLRFVEADTEREPEEWWYFSSEERKKIREFMDTRENPFSQETNQEFLELFQKCRRYEEDVGYE